MTISALNSSSHHSSRFDFISQLSNDTSEKPRDSATKLACCPEDFRKCLELR